jgi:hypothetical protein
LDSVNWRFYTDADVINQLLGGGSYEAAGLRSS